MEGIIASPYSLNGMPTERKNANADILDRMYGMLDGSQVYRWLYLTRWTRRLV